VGVVCGFDLQSVKAQMRQANNLGAKWVVMRGGDERSQDAVKLKDMHSGAEELVPADEMVTALRQRLNRS
jgi:histidyl-tRNA synthetase